MTGLTTGFVARAMRDRGYQVRAGPDLPISGGDADSRRIRPGQLFAAYPGDNTDGNRYIDSAFERGAVAAICSAPPARAWPGKTIVIAADTTRAAGELGSAWRAACPRPRVVGITGTVGKTTCKELTAAVLKEHFAAHWSEGGLNSRQGLPLAMLSLRPDHEVSVLEMGMDSKGEIAELCAMARPEFGVVLNIGLTHIEKLGTIEAIAEEKLSLPRALPPTGVAVLNADDPRIAAAIPGLPCRVMTFGRDQGAALPRAMYTFSSVKSYGLDGTRFFVSTAARSARVRSAIAGEHTIPGAVAALCVAVALGIDLSDAARSLSTSGVTGRTRTIPGFNGSTLIDDRYNASPASMRGALETLKRLGPRRIALLGKMAELGPFEAEQHREAGRLAAESCDALFAVGEACRVLVEAAREAGLREATWFADKDEAAAAVKAMLQPGDSVLLKASRSQEFETIIPTLEAAP